MITHGIECGSRCEGDWRYRQDPEHNDGDVGSEAQVKRPNKFLQEI